MSIASHARYTTVAIILHWLIALCVIGLIAAGIWMSDAIKDPKTQGLAFVVYQWHKSLGLTVLVLSVARLIWRLMHPAPALPASLTPFERRAAHATHVAFYVLMIGLPLLGWALVSSSPLGIPTIVFGLFEWPHIGWLAGLDDKKPVEDALKYAHGTAGYVMAGLILLHVGAALKHQFIDRDTVLSRMLPWARRRQEEPGTAGHGS